jgi:hypothetical protein
MTMDSKGARSLGRRFLFHAYRIVAERSLLARASGLPPQRRCAPARGALPPAPARLPPADSRPGIAAGRRLNGSARPPRRCVLGFDSPGVSTPSSTSAAALAAQQRRALILSPPRDRSATRLSVKRLSSIFARLRRKVAPVSPRRNSPPACGGLAPTSTRSSASPAWHWPRGAGADLWTSPRGGPGLTAAALDRRAARRARRWPSAATATPG